MIQAIRAVFRECWNDRRRMLAVSAYNLSFQNNQTKLKLLWTILNPVLQAGTYWFAYYVGLRVTSPIQGVPYLAWMLTGLVPWFFISALMTSGPLCIVSARAIIKNMSYPMGTIPVSTVCTELLSHLCYMLVLIAIQIGIGVRYGIGVLWVFYYMAAAFFLMLGYTFFFSTITVFVRDTAKLLQAVVRLLFFITPICWSLPPDNPLYGVMQWNPLLYVINGYRDAMLYRGVITAPPWQHVWFWTVTAVVLLVGVWLHWKLRDYFVDDL